MGVKPDEKSGDLEKNATELGPEIGKVGKILHSWMDFILSRQARVVQLDISSMLYFLPIE